MELVNSPMKERQKLFRQNYRERLAGWYHGWVHLVIIYATGFTALYIYLANVDRVQWWELAAWPIGFLAYQLGEYLLHVHVLHRPRRNVILRALYVRHTLMHHQFFTRDEMRFADHMDWRVTLFPPFTAIGLTLLWVPPALLAGWLLSANFGWLVMASLMGSYLFYEMIHFCCHLDDNVVLRHLPIINSARRHHAAHHDQGLMMEVNMGIGTPIFDWALGTSDLNRGLLGHIFNGNSTRYVRTDLRKTYRTPRPSKVTQTTVAS